MIYTNQKTNQESNIPQLVNIESKPKQIKEFLRTEFVRDKADIDT